MTSKTTSKDGGSATVAMVAGLLLLAVPLVGCAENGSQSSATDGEAMTAEDGLPDARAVADDWSDEAPLIGAGTLETTEEAPEDWASEAPEFQTDDDVGDGLAHQWSYTFKNTEEERINVYVTSKGETYREAANQSDAFMDAEIGDWEVDSAEAADLAKEESEDFSSTLATDDAEVGLIIAGGEDGDEAWIVDVQSESEDEQVTLSVDANTGEVERFGA